MSATAPAINPCFHMRGLVHRLAEDSLSGALLRYARYHVRTCTRCRQAYEAIRATVERLRSMRTLEPKLPEDRWASIEAAWRDHEQTDPPN